MASPKATSSMCGDPNQVRYQKALKEITKLINYNNQVKQQLATAQQQLNSVNDKFTYKDARINQLVQQKQDLQTQLNQLTRKYLDLEEQNVKLNMEVEELRKKSNLSAQNIPNIAITQSRNMIDDSKRIRPFSKDSANFHQRKIQDLQKALAQKNQTVRQLYSSNNQLRNRIENMAFAQSPSNNINNINNMSNINNIKNGNNLASRSLKNYSQDIPNFMQTFNRNNEIIQLQKKLRASEEWNENLMSQCAQLKAKVLKYEGTNNFLMKVRSEKMFLSNYPRLDSPRSAYMMNSPSYNTRDDDTQMIKKAKKLQKQNKKLQKKFHQNKLQMQIYEEQNKKLRKQEKVLSMKIAGYEKIIEKQQKQMQEMLKTNQKQLQYYREDFKEKLEEQRKSFSPSKNAKTLKLIQTLQAQNKALKKKFQLISIELTKYVKTLQVYKLKLSQYERQIGQYADQRRKLYEELARVKGSRRERSTHSKNSMIKQGTQQNFGNSSIIEDI